MLSTGCAKEKVDHVLAIRFPQRNPQAASACLWKRCADMPSAEGFSPAAERVRLTVHRHAKPARLAGSGAARNRSNEPRAVGPVGYHSRVCSTTGDAIERIAAAIDQLANDARDASSARGATGQRELSRRVARLWQMVSDLDPELARRARRYTAPADGGPSA